MAKRMRTGMRQPGASEKANNATRDMATAAPGGERRLARTEDLRRVLRAHANMLDQGFANLLGQRKYSLPAYFS